MNELIQGLGLDLRAFCHLEPGHGFADGGVRSLLCARCMGIYGGFLLAWLLALALRWNGRWGRAGLVLQAAVALGLVGASALHVLAEILVKSPFTAANETHFVVGCLSGLGLLQLALLMREGDRAGCRAPSWAVAGLLLVAFAGLLLLDRRFPGAGSLPSLAGLVLLYAVMNAQLLRAFLPRLPAWGLWALVVPAVAAEWMFLLWYKTGWPAGR